MPRGRTAKPPHLRVLEGDRSHRRVLSHTPATYDPDHDNGLEPSHLLTAEQEALWDRYIRTASWLAPPDAALAEVWVITFAMWGANPTAAGASALRQLSASLGLDPVSRQRMAPTGPPKSKFTTLLGKAPIKPVRGP